MIERVTMYQCKCDRCGKVHEYDQIIAWADEGTALEFATDSEWCQIDNKIYCPDCYTYNEDTDEYEPKPKEDQK